MSRPARHALATLAASIAALLAVASPAAAAPPCADQPSSVTTLLQGQETMESVIVDSRGRLFFTAGNSVMRLDNRGEPPVLLASVTSPGGLAFDGDGKLVVGAGNSIANGTVGDATGPSALLKIDPDTGAQQPYATGLSVATGSRVGPTAPSTRRTTSA